MGFFFACLSVFIFCGFFCFKVPSIHFNSWLLMTSLNGSKECKWLGWGENVGGTLIPHLSAALRFHQRFPTLKYHKRNMRLMFIGCFLVFFLETYPLKLAQERGGIGFKGIRSHGRQKLTGANANEQLGFCYNKAATPRICFFTSRCQLVTSCLFVHRPKTTWPSSLGSTALSISGHAYVGQCICWLYLIQAAVLGLGRDS